MRFGENTMMVDSGGTYFRRDGRGRFASHRWASLEEAREAAAAAREAYRPKAVLRFEDCPEPPEASRFTVERVDPEKMAGKWWVAFSDEYPVVVAVGNCLDDVAEERATFMAGVLNGIAAAKTGWRCKTRFLDGGEFRENMAADAYRISVDGKTVGCVAFDREVDPEKAQRAAQAVVNDKGARKALWHGRG